MTLQISSTEGESILIGFTISTRIEACSGTKPPHRETCGGDDDEASLKFEKKLVVAGHYTPELLELCEEALKLGRVPAEPPVASVRAAKFGSRRMTGIAPAFRKVS
ncbi:hypothetical protein CU103_25695 [Phyllobacterium sophorae]|uniref:Uncharacterized protein n=2 Tax=Phyllobacterium sophorae TaxID=1520277 RepID=A0A2P7B3B5_9HYPH|nr:hypothetical protein CU103_25695 [Phyllobacterium sophorae]